MKLLNLLEYLRENGLQYEIKDLKYNNFVNILIEIQYGDLEVIFNQNEEFDLYYGNNQHMYNISLENTKMNIKNYLIG